MKKLEALAAQGKINQNASLRDKQAIIINANIDKIWSVLMDFEKWPEWNDQIRWVKTDKVEEGTPFTWNIKGAVIKSTIQKIIAPELLTWVGKYKGLKVIHVWKLEQLEGTQTIVTCEESMQGFLTIFSGHQNLHDTLIYWLDKLKSKAEQED